MIMKKGLLFGIICLVIVAGLVAVVCLVGGSADKKLTCTLTGKTSNGTEVNVEYIIKYKGDYVKELKTVEKATTSDKTALATYKEETEKAYSKYKDTKYYDYSVKVSDDTITATVTINYEKIDTKKLIEISPNSKNIIENGKVKVKDLQKTYETTGAKCK